MHAVDCLRLIIPTKSLILPPPLYKYVGFQLQGLFHIAFAIVNSSTHAIAFWVAPMITQWNLRGLYVQTLSFYITLYHDKIMPGFHAGFFIAGRNNVFLHRHLGRFGGMLPRKKICISGLFWPKIIVDFKAIIAIFEQSSRWINLKSWYLYYCRIPWLCPPLHASTGQNQREFFDFKPKPKSKPRHGPIIEHMHNLDER